MSARKRPRGSRVKAARTKAFKPRGCRRDGARPGLQVFELVGECVMSTAVRRRLRQMDPRAEKCEGEGSPSCLRNRGAEIECENGVCTNRVVQRGIRVPTEAQWYDGKGWGLKLAKDASKGELVERYVGEVLEPEDFWERFKHMTGEEPLYFCEFVQGLIIDAGSKGSFARLINHSCEPSAILRHWSVKGMRQVVVTMLRDARAGEEVTVAYRDPVSSRNWVCKCGKASCEQVAKEAVRVRDAGVPVPREGGGEEVVVVSDDGC